MRIVVTGGTGMVGAHVVAELLARGVQVRVPTRSAEKLAALPEGVEGVIGDLGTAATVRGVFRDAEAVFLLNAIAPAELHEGLLALAGALASGVRRIVYLSVLHAEVLPLAPHFAAKVAIERALRDSDVEWTVLRPGSFYQNDLLAREAILEHGVYPHPLGEAGVSRVDARDVARAAAVALTEAGHEGQTYDLGERTVTTGPSIAAAWSAALGTPVRYAGDDLDAWEANLRPFLPDWLLHDLRLMYEQMQRAGLRIAPEAARRQEALLGRAPRAFEEFVRETVEGWRG